MPYCAESVAQPNKAKSKRVAKCFIYNQVFIRAKITKKLNIVKGLCSLMPHSPQIELIIAYK